MKILQLCNKSPLPPREGGSIAMYHLANALIEDGHHVDMLAVTTPKFSHNQKWQMISIVPIVRSIIVLLILLFIF